MNDNFEIENEMEEESLQTDETENADIVQENPEISNSSSDLVVVSGILPKQLPLIPLRERPVFPGISVPLILNGKEYVKAIREAKEHHQNHIGVVLTQEAKQEDLFDKPVYRVGTVMKIFRVEPLAEDTIQVFAQSLHRFKVLRVKRQDSLLKAHVTYHYDPTDKPNEEQRAYAMAIMSSARELLKLNPMFQEQLKMLLSHISLDKPGLLMDVIASMLSLEAKRLQEILEAFDLQERGNKLLLALKEEIELTKIQESIRRQIDEKVNHQQKEFFLREQLKVIKKELGIEKDDKSAEIEKIQERLKKLELTEEAQKVVNDELQKLQMLEPISPEYNVSRNYLEILTELPWGIQTQDTLDIQKAREILDADHYGLKDVKMTILQFISTLVKKGSLTGNNILLVGPPGVGKTSIGKSIAAALNRKFYRFSVGGMRDEAEIKGHRRTYIGAMPGKLIESLRRTGSANPVVMIDELDKVGKSYQGDPASALLEVLDPEQNNSFLDHFLDVRFDLSNVLFIATANQLDTIPGPLLDRMEIIRLPGYITEEKVEIAKKYLVPKQRKEHGLTVKEIQISEPALRQIVEGYAREAGVRNLENQIKKIMRQVTLKQAEGKQRYFKVSLKNLEKFLGKPIFSTEELYQEDLPGVALGLAYTAMGGATLYIEANSVEHENGGLKLTGQLGDVMKESASIAHSYVQAFLGSQKDQPVAVRTYFDNHRVHLHIPAGATPKDGPSAGITMALALYSLATNRPIRRDIGMTGELTLTGKVLPIGGVREKTIAARRVGIKELIFPKANQKDFDELPDYTKEGITPYYAEYFEDVLKRALR